MQLKKGGKQSKIAEAIGASRVIHLSGKKLGGPLDWLQLAKKLQARLISKGGRPSDPHWNTRRLVPFRNETWKLLTKEAETISAKGRKVGPAQLASIVIEECFTGTKGIEQFYIFGSGLHTKSTHIDYNEPKFTLGLPIQPNSNPFKMETKWTPDKTLIITNLTSLVIGE